MVYIPYGLTLFLTPGELPNNSAESLFGVIGVATEAAAASSVVRRYLKLSVGGEGFAKGIAIGALGALMDNAPSCAELIVPTAVTDELVIAIGAVLDALLLPLMGSGWVGPALAI
jgi:hypothetical protein